MLNKFRLMIVAGIALGLGYALALAQGANIVTVLSGAYSMPINTVGPQIAVVPLNAGTTTCNGTSTVTVTASTVTAGSFIIFTLKTVGGTVGAYPAVKTTTAGTGFTFACTASDTSIYTYLILG